MAPSGISTPRISTQKSCPSFHHNPVKLGESAWSRPAAAAYDFRSDYVTVPTFPMLQSIMNTTLRDDVMMEDPTTNEFQEFMANLTGKEEALFMLSGTMGNQVALRAALKAPPYSILADERSHAIRMEVGGAATLCGALIIGIRPSNGHHLVLDDIRRHATLTSGLYGCPTRVISLENTLSGTIMPLKDVQEISTWARSQPEPIHMHLDGARLWEADAAAAGSLQQYCKEFDSVTLCLTKGLGAPIGSVVLGSSEFIERARMVRKLLGGGIRAAGVLTAPAKVAVEQIFLGGRLRAAQDIAKSLAATWTLLGGRLTNPTETNMVWLDLNDPEVDQARFFALAKAKGLKVMEGMLAGRLVVHYQICLDAVSRLRGVMEEVLSGKGIQGPGSSK
ncbi:putative low-specificity L-threonine aldolase [Microsporum canis]